MTLPEGVRIEPLRRQDVRGALEVKNAGWRDTYLPWLGEEYLDRRDAAIDGDVAAWSAALEDDRLMPTWVALTPDDAVIGVGAGGTTERVSAVSGRLAGPSATGTSHQLGVLYVHAAWRGRGVAEELARAVIGHHSAQLWVLEENPRAHAFYAKLGFRPDGAAQELPPEWNGAREVRMVRP